MPGWNNFYIEEIVMKNLQINIFLKYHYINLIKNLVGVDFISFLKKINKKFFEINENEYKGYI